MAHRCRSAMLGFIDRSIRPHFPEGLHNEIQLSIMLLSIDKDNDPKRTHLSDALGYLIWQECREPVGERRERLF